MSWKNLLFESFIRGVGKTSAALVVCGVLGGIWTLYSSYTDNNTKLNYEENENDKNKQNNTNEVTDINEDEYEYEYTFKNKENKFKSIFDNL